jgi:hypothetical protein
MNADVRSSSPLGVLEHGTAFYAPIGEVIVEGALVTSHLRGRSLRSVTAHLRAHGWTKLAYCEAFGLERNQSLEGPETRHRRRGWPDEPCCGELAAPPWRAMAQKSGQPQSWLRRQVPGG